MSYTQLAEHKEEKTKFNLPNSSFQRCKSNTIFRHHQIIRAKVCALLAPEGAICSRKEEGGRTKEEGDMISRTSTLIYEYIIFVLFSFLLRPSSFLELPSLRAWSVSYKIFASFDLSSSANDLRMASLMEQVLSNCCSTIRGFISFTIRITWFIIG